MNSIPTEEAKKPKPQLLLLRPYPNGGWTIEAPADQMGVMPAHIGAYTSTDDMIAGLSAAVYS